jgi:hypothetical protein
LLAASSSLPGSRNEPDRLCFLFGLAPGGVCQARRVTPPAGALLPHRFTLAGGAVNFQLRLLTDGGSSGGLLSVALSLTSRPVDVIHHPVLRCPDFPPIRRGEPAITQPSSGSINYSIPRFYAAIASVLAS